jgi:hypothetical protein
MWVTARLKPGVSLGQANAEVEACARRLAKESPKTSGGFRASLMPVWKAHLGMQTVLLAALRILMAVCFVVFLIVGANVANLQLARATARRKELSVRMALGADRWRLARQLLTESLLMATMGALAGVALAAWLGRSLLWMLPPFGYPVDFDFSLNADVLGFIVLLCCAASVLTGLAPAVHSVTGSLVEALKEGGRGGTAGARQNRTRGLLVVSEVALALVGTALFTRSFQNARAIHPGFDAGNVLFAEYHRDTFCQNTEQRAQFCYRLRDRIRQLSGIAAVSFGNSVPLDIGSGPRSGLQVEGYAPRPNEQMTVSSATVAPCSARCRCCWRRWECTACWRTAVSHRAHEFGIRLALGAEPSDVVVLVLRRGMALTAAGIVVGTVLAVAAMRMTAELLVGVSPGDPVTIAGSALFLGAIALLASYLPARRATKVDPMAVLRDR